jgi:cyclic beta-1,2-glucan synthetase
VQLVHRLRDQDPKITPALLWLEQELAEHETSSERLLQEEHLRQGASNVTVRNIITSMRLMSDVDWAEFFEQVSLVDDALIPRRISGHGFRDAQPVSQRHRGTGARIEAVGAGDRQACPGDGRGRHESARTRPWLPPDCGRAAGSWSATSTSMRRGATGRAASPSPSARATTSRPSRSLRRWCFPFPLSLLLQAGVHGGMLWLLGVLGVVPAVDIAVALINRAVTRGVGASRLPASRCAMVCRPSCARWSRCR